METISQEQFDAFTAYMRQMLNDIADARLGYYHNNETMVEIAMVWNEGEEPAVKNYPMPENLTHVAEKPRPNHMEMGDYAFKKVLYTLMGQAGFQETDGMFISEMGNGECSINMHSGYDSDDDYASVIYMLFIRSSEDLSPAQDYLRSVEDDVLEDVCRDVLEGYGLCLEDDTRAAPRAGPCGPKLAP